jgi:hypothetical protein
LTLRTRSIWVESGSAVAKPLAAMLHECRDRFIGGKKLVRISIDEDVPKLFEQHIEVFRRQRRKPNYRPREAYKSISRE